MIDNETLNLEIEKYIETLKKCEYIMEKEVKFLCDKAKEILIKEENVVYLSSPITVKILVNNRSAVIFMANFTTL